MSDQNIEQQNSYQSRVERREQKRAARKSQISQSRRNQVFKKLGYWLLGLVVLGAGIWFLVTFTGPEGTDYSQAYPILGRNHIADGSTSTYNSNPPTSGDHYAAPATVRFYDRALPDGQLIHNMEHGHIWIAYQPDISPEIIDKLKDFTGGNVIAAPRSDNDLDIALVAWGRLDKFDIENNELPLQRIKDFIIRYQNRGPENLH